MAATTQDGPDLTICISGREGSGKSCLMGDIAAMLRLYGFEVRCFHRRRDGYDLRVEAPEEGHFNEVRKVKIVEVLNDR